MLNIKSKFSTILIIFLLSSVQSFADTFIVTNLNDPGEGSLRQAIDDSNATEGPDEIVFQEGLTGTIVLNLDQIFIQDDLTIVGPGADKITIDAGGKSDIFAVHDFDEEINRVVEISGLRFIDGNAFEDGAIVNYEILTVDSCEFIDGNASFGGGAIGNRNILTVNSCLFDNNSAPDGGAIRNYDEAISLSILNSNFINNQADSSGGGAIFNESTIELIANSTFSENIVLQGSADGGAIFNFGKIQEISNSTFAGNTALNEGGAIRNYINATIETIVNCTFNGNSAFDGGAFFNEGMINISFTTITGNHSNNISLGGGITTTLSGITRVRNSILSSNFPDNCNSPVDDLLGNYSDDSSCGFIGDNSEIVLDVLDDYGGPTQTMNLVGGDPDDGATINCDALDEMGVPTGIPLEIDQRYFPRPDGERCDAGAVEPSSESIVTITKATNPSGRSGFEFETEGFSGLVGCGFRGDNGNFTLDDEESIQCRIPKGNYTIKEKIPDGYDLVIVCFQTVQTLMIDDEAGEISFTIDEADSSDIDCLFTNIKKDGNGGCTLSSNSNNSGNMFSALLPILFIFTLILIRRLREIFN